ncbi:MAG: APC family permease [Planctomycetota bacterium]
MSSSSNPGASDAADPERTPDETLTFLQRMERLLIGRPRDLRDRHMFRRLSLIPLLAWVGLGADGLSSSSYGPAEAFHALGSHTYLALGLAAATALTVFVISACYSGIIEQFPSGGGAYVVTTKLLGPSAGAVAGTALLVDYVLTITVSIAAAGDALFSLVAAGPASHSVKLWIEIGLIVLLMVLNLRGVRESVLVLLPFFLLFLVTHVVVMGGSMIVGGAHLRDLPATVVEGFRRGNEDPGSFKLWTRFLFAYSLGAGTYTGIEAVSNGLPLMREPRVENGRRTMLYMAVSLAVTAAGLLLCYLLLDIKFEQHKTMNAALTERFVALTQSADGHGILGGWFVALTLVSEAALLIVASQTGFLGGPRVMANLAQDSWIPHRFAALSDRLTTQNGIVLIGLASLGALLYTNGNTHTLVIMYSINVFVTFTLSMLGMSRFFVQHRSEEKQWQRQLFLFSAGTVLCGTILVITLFEKFLEGGWVTIAVTGALLLLCFTIHRHYRTVYAKLAELDRLLGDLRLQGRAEPRQLDRTQPTAAVLVSRYGGLGTHTVLNVLRLLPGYFKNMVFVSVGVIDTGNFKGRRDVRALERQTHENLDEFVKLAQALGMAAESRYAIGTDTVDEAEALCEQLARDYHRIVFFAGQLIFQREAWYQRLLHNQTAFAIQRRLQWAGLPMVILPVRVTE